MKSGFLFFFSVKSSLAGFLLRRKTPKYRYSSIYDHNREEKPSCKFIAFVTLGVHVTGQVCRPFPKAVVKRITVIIKAMAWQQNKSILPNCCSLLEIAQKKPKNCSYVTGRRKWLLRNIFWQVTLAALPSLAFPGKEGLFNYKGGLLWFFIVKPIPPNNIDLCGMSHYRKTASSALYFSVYFCTGGLDGPRVN